MAKTTVSPGTVARVELEKRGQWDPARKRCSVCDNTPESHLDPVTNKFRGCGAAKRLNMDGKPWNREGEWRLIIEDFPKRGIRSEQERIAYSIVKAFAKQGKYITSNALSAANNTWSARDAYRLLTALEFRGIIEKVNVGEEESESAGEETE